MLERLYIKNFALIDEVDLQWDKGLSSITGETGSGKSIMLGALNLILGKRADLQSVKDKSKKCIVEGHFLLNETAYLSFFEQEELDFEEHTILRREILQSGKSRAFVNDSPVTLDQLRALADRLIDVHSQHDTHLLNHAPYQLQLIDHFAQNEKERQDYTNAYIHWQQTRKALAEIEQLTVDGAGADLEYLQFVAEELHAAAIKEGEQEALEEELRALSHVEELTEALVLVQKALDDEEIGALGKIHEADSHLRAVLRYQKNVEELHNRLHSCEIELRDIAREAEQLAERAENDPLRLREMEIRLELLNNLCHKHKVQSADELPAVLEKIDAKIEWISGSADKRKMLKESLLKAEEQLLQSGKILRASREKILPILQDQIHKVLVQLNFKEAQFKFHLNEKEAGTDGIDNPAFLFSANPGAEPQAIRKIASGGELSRIMLAIKYVLAGSKSLPTLIFDEIDTGIGGETAGRVAQLLREMSKNVQLIAITHLPQIAAAGEKQYRVFKDYKGEVFQTQVVSLNPDERILELARMLSGEKVSEAAMRNAKELLSSVS